MGDDSEHIRIGTAEREDAMDLLGRQFAEGRLTPEEFSERSAAVSSATTRADLEPLFADLPVLPDESVPLIQRRDWRPTLMAFLPLIALGVTILVPHGWLAWLAIPAAGILLYGPGR